MSLSITLTTEDTPKLIDTINILDHVFSQLASDHNLTYAPEDISELSSWYKNIVQVIRYNNYDTLSSTDEDYLSSLSN